MLKKLGLRPVYLFIAVTLIAVGIMVYWLLKPADQEPTPQPAPASAPAPAPVNQPPTTDEERLEQRRDSLYNI
ncbi:hypothetical protein [Fibrella forsythiae]|uniref:Uncharacterized protein n=1 Tax=Fibrella forsythiae TaxID=2817061 RepID=A0ABS3JCX1_9BACT|nr:hypothetical protein [Fibrella forsythiae]MBO0947293.1 hypothetical protein [Fibrella forsythiae]